MLEQQLIILAVLFFFVIVGRAIATKFRQPISIGLLVVGALMGPNALNMIKDQNTLSMMAEIGSILLLFTIGLEFVIPKLVKIGVKATILGLLKIGIIFFMSYETFLLLKMSPQVAFIFGLLLSISSTVVIVKILEAKKLYKREEMPLLIGILLIEDIFAVTVLTFLTQPGNEGLAIFEDILIALIVLIIVYFLMLKISKLIMEWIINNSGEGGVTFIMLTLCLGFSALSYFLGLSPAIGAFLAGSIVASLPSINLFKNAISPYTDIFTSLFFMAMGAMVNLVFVKDNLSLIGILLVLVIVSRFVAVGIISYLFANFKIHQMIFSSIAMISVSEFSLLLAHSVMRFNLGIDFVSITASIVLITAILMSLTINYYGKVSDLVDNTAKGDWIDKPKSFSNYIQLLFSEMDVENSYTKSFKKLSFRILTYIFFAIFTFVGGLKLVSTFTHYSLPAYYTYLAYSAIILIGGFLFYLIYLEGKKLRNTLITIISNSDSCNVKRSSYILNNLTTAMFLFMLATFSPFVIVPFNLPLWSNAIPFALLAVVTIRLKKVTTVIHHSSLRRRVSTF